MSARLTDEKIKPAQVSEAALVKGLENGRYQFDLDGTLEKCCSVCKDYWPADTEFFFSNVNCVDGLGNCCKACYVERRFPHSRGSVGHQFGAHRGQP